MPLKMSEAKDKVIVIIVSYNSKQYWPDLLPQLVKEQYDEFAWQILVVDNNSSDGSADYIEERYPSIKVIRNQDNLGFVGGNNIGYNYAKQQGADYIYLLNSDTIITPGFLQPLYHFAKEHKYVGSLQSKLKLWPAKDRINSLGNAIHFLGFGYVSHLNQIDKGYQEIKKINYASGAGVFLSMKALNKQGHLFDETMFMYSEDLDLGWSLSLLGYDNYLIPDSVIYHKYEFSRGMRQYYWFERNRLWVILKNYKLGTLLLITPACLLMELGQLFFAVKNRTFFKKIKAYSFLVSPPQLRILFKKRKYLQSRRVRSDRQVAGRFSGLILFQPLDSWVLKIANVFFFIYWRIIKLFIFW